MARPRIRPAVVNLFQGPALQNMDRPAAGDRPFDVLGHAVMIFDANGDLRKLRGLIVRQAGTGAFLIRQIHAADAFLGVADEFSLLGADPF